MKGQKAYNLAKVVHEKMYSAPHTIEEQKNLYAQYFELIKKAAYLGHIESLYDMGNQFEDIGYLGIPNPMYNPKKCVYWYIKACEKGNAEACNNLASLYESGRGCERNLDIALGLYNRSANYKTYKTPLYLFVLKSLSSCLNLLLLSMKLLRL
jgi:TPR repeat protein